MSPRNTEETRLQIKVLWDQGLSATQIGVQLAISRSSVLGNVHRMREQGIDLARRQKTPPAKKEKVPADRIITPKPISKYAYKLFFPKIDTDPNRKTGIGIMQLKADSCRFVVADGSQTEDGTAMYCGKMIQDRSFCLDHFKLCYAPSQKGVKVAPVLYEKKRSLFLIRRH